MVQLSTEEQKIVAQKEKYIETLQAELLKCEEGGTLHTQLLSSINQAEQFIQHIHKSAEIQAEITALVGENASSLDRSMAGLYLWMKHELQVEVLPTKKRSAKKLSRNQQITNAVEALMRVHDENERMEKLMQLPEDIQEEVFQIFAYPADRDGR